MCVIIAMAVRHACAGVLVLVLLMHFLCVWYPVRRGKWGARGAGCHVHCTTKSCNALVIAQQGASNRAGVVHWAVHFETGTALQPGLGDPFGQVFKQPRGIICECKGNEGWQQVGSLAALPINLGAMQVAVTSLLSCAGCLANSNAAVLGVSMWFDPCPA